MYGILTGRPSAPGLSGLIRCRCLSLDPDMQGAWLFRPSADGCTFPIAQPQPSSSAAGWPELPPPSYWPNVVWTSPCLKGRIFSGVAPVPGLTACATALPLRWSEGFHAFFRQYYNLRQLLRRIDPDLSFLKATTDYPILTPTGNESFAGLTHAPLVNVAKLTWRTDTLGLRDLMRVNVPAALAMLRFDRPQTYAEFDQRTAGAYLDSLNFPPLARQRLLHVFAHSCFNPQADMSAAELLQMLHFYFTANYDGLVFDVADRPFSHCIFQPLGRAAWPARRQRPYGYQGPRTGAARGGLGGGDRQRTAGRRHGRAGHGRGSAQGNSRRLPLAWRTPNGCGGSTPCA